VNRLWKSISTRGSQATACAVLLFLLAPVQVVRKNASRNRSSTTSVEVLCTSASVFVFHGPVRFGWAKILFVFLDHVSVIPN
jgi:hypothetical protein